MTGAQNLLGYLLQRGVPFELHEHRTAYTATEVAAAEHVPGKDFAKVVMVEADGRLVMLVLPASHRANLWRVADMMGALEVRLACEREFAGAFRDCETGAMPPFGNLYHVPVFVDRALAADERIVFQAGTHTQSMSMRYADFIRLANPGIASFAIPPRQRQAAAAAA